MLRRQPAGLASELAPPSVHQVLRSPGQPLDLPTRSFMESRLGHSFGEVQIHTGERAAASARSVDAVAYTVGRHIVFGSGAYRPGTSVGRQLLAHELRHVVQQRAKSVTGASLIVGPVGDAAEREADAVARTIGSAASNVGIPTDPAEAPAGTRLQRQPAQSKPVIPMPVFDEFDPMVSVPDVPGVPGFLRGQNARLSDVKKALDFLRGSSSESPKNCDPAIGFERAGMGEFKGLCCRGHMRSKENCCEFKQIAIFDNRCCNGLLEVVINGRCVQLPPAPLPAAPPLPSPTPRAPGPSPPTQQPAPGAMSIPFKLDKPAAGYTGPNSLQASLAEGGHEALAAMISTLKSSSTLEVQLVGRASPEGTAEYNMSLGARRAVLVSQALTAAGIPQSQIADPPTSDLAADCQRIGPGTVTCGEVGSSGPADRQVLGRFFALPSQAP